MKFLAISVIYLFLSQLHARESREEILSRQDFYSGQSYSLIDWKRMDTVQWLDLGEWKDDIALKDQEPNWRRNLRERGLVEEIGRGIECIGECQLHRGSGSAQLNWRSKVIEGDEIVTGKDSYAWIFMLDGSMLRVSPNTSISFKEINISHSTIFHHARLNYGHMFWHARQEEAFAVSELKETDSLFLPLNFYDANMFVDSKVTTNREFFVDNKRTPAVKLQYERLNKAIEKNNEWAKGKKSALFLVMQNGTVVAENPILEAIALPGTESFVKNRLSKDVGLVSERETWAKSYMRGYDNQESNDIETGQWYRFDARGREFSKELNTQRFSTIEYLTTRIPTIMMARELYMKEVSSFIFDKKLDRAKYALSYGYRLWSGDLETGEIKRRHDFMLEYSRRSETTLLIETEKFNRNLRERGEVVQVSEWSEAFYIKAIDAYALAPERIRLDTFEGEILNSTKKPLWKIMNARKKL